MTNYRYHSTAVGGLPCEGRCDSVCSAVQVSTYKSKIDETTRKMMALVSELSMQQVSTYIQYVCKYICTYVHSVYVCMYM